MSSEIETGGGTGAAAGFEPELDPGAGVDVPDVGAPLDEPDPGALDWVPDEQPASRAARATAATTFLMRTILANRANCEPGDARPTGQLSTGHHGE